jgi:beta-RFAP synthase
LLSLPSEEFWTNVFGQASLRRRQYGGVGLMVKSPGLQLAAEPAANWKAEGPLAERTLRYAQRFVQTAAFMKIDPLRFYIKQAPGEHLGLGTGTQLAMAVARAISIAAGVPDLGVAELARLLGRGSRSALGIHGFDRGGFLIEAGKQGRDSVSPLILHASFPDPWRVVLMLTPWGRGLHGPEESDAFHRLQSRSMLVTTTDALCRLVLLGMLPALIERDWESFSEAVHDYNARVGSTFAPVQGGIYASPGLADLVAFVRRQGIRGVGQSSWGPTAFAITKDEDQAKHLVRCIRREFNWSEREVFVTEACDRGATVDESAG